jgi:hypothetical protein
MVTQKRNPDRGGDVLTVTPWWQARKLFNGVNQPSLDRCLVAKE